MRHELVPPVVNVLPRSDDCPSAGTVPRQGPRFRHSDANRFIGNPTPERTTVFISRAALGAAVVAMLLSGCSAGDKTAATGPVKSSPSTASAKTAEPAKTATVFGDSKAEVAVATEWTQKWCAVHVGDTKSQAIATMGTPRPEGTHTLVWGDDDYEFGVKLTKNGTVKGHW